MGGQKVESRPLSLVPRCAPPCRVPLVRPVATRVSKPTRRSRMKPVLYRVLWCCLLAMGLQATGAEAVVVPQKDSALAEKSFRQPELTVPEVNQQLSEIPALAAGLQNDLSALGVNADQGFFDTRSGRWSSLILTTPLVPGTGYGNTLRWVDLAASKPLDDA